MTRQTDKANVEEMVQMESGDEVARLRAERKALDERIKAAAAQAKAASVKTLEQVIAEERTVMAAWTMRDIQRVTVRVLARLHAGQERDEALDGMLATLRAVLSAELDRRGE